MTAVLAVVAAAWLCAVLHVVWGAGYWAGYLQALLDRRQP